MKGIVPNRTEWFKLEDTSVPLAKELNSMKIKTGEGYTDFVSLSDEQKRQVINNLEASANGVLKALNGERRPGISIRDFARNVINDGTFGSVFSTAVEVFMMDYIRPRLVVSNYLARTIPVGPSFNQSMIAMVKSFGMVKVSEVSRNGSYATVQPSLNDYTSQISFGSKKYGVKLEIDQDFGKSDQWGLLGFTMTSIADGFAYRKEEEVIKIINSTGKVMYDNSNPPGGVFGVTTSGRGINGAHNGTVTIEDITRVMAYASMRGMDIGYMLIHPFAVWEMFGDSQLRSILGTATMAGRVPAPFNNGWVNPLGEEYAIRVRTYGSDGVGNAPGNIANWGEIVGNGPYRGIDPYSVGLSTTHAYGVMNATLPAGATLTVIVTPQVPIRRVTISGIDKFATNIYLISRYQPVAILQEEPLGTIEWKDVEKEISYIAMREKYSVIPLHQGRGTYVLKNVIIDRNYPDPVRTLAIPSISEPGVTPLFT